MTITIRSLLLLAFCFSALVALAAENQPNLVHGAKKAGVESCLEQWQAAGVFLENNTTSFGWNLTWNRHDTSGRMVTAITESAFSDASVIAAVTIAPTLGGGCDVTIVRIFSTDVHCAVAAAQVEDGAVPQVVSRRTLVVATPGANISYFNPGGEDGTCVQVNVETLYFDLDH